MVRFPLVGGKHVAEVGTESGKEELQAIGSETGLHNECAEPDMGVVALVAARRSLVKRDNNTNVADMDGEEGNCEQ